MNAMLSPDVRAQLSSIISHREITRVQPVSGGSINRSFKIITAGGIPYFCKTNAATTLPQLFEKEKTGLEAIARTGTIAAPGNVLTGRTVKEQWILMDWIESKPAIDPFWKNFGAALAALHHQVSDTFGFTENNYMGALPQSNTCHAKWEDFFREERLMPQVKMASEKGLLATGEVKLFEKLYLRLPSILTEEKPCLVHGDLWSGNFIAAKNAQPVVIDPAVYYGNRLVDLAMTTLFGGFDDGFYAAYQYHYTLPSNYKEQWRILNLYPLLIHLNLFGKSYHSSIIGTIAAY